MLKRSYGIKIPGTIARIISPCVADAKDANSNVPQSNPVNLIDIKPEDFASLAAIVFHKGDQISSAY